MFMKDCWQVAGFAGEIGRSLLARTLAGEKLVLFRTEDGTPGALEDRCAHRYVPLSLGTLVGDTVQCGYHGLCYDRTGQCVKVPGQDRIPSAAVVRSYPVVERYSFIWVWLGDALKADPDLVPDFHWMTDPAWAISAGYHHVGANYQFLNDNLLDLTHESFVHTESIGNAAVAESPLAVEVRDGSARAHRDMYDCAPPPFYVKAAGFSSNIDRWHTTIFTPPAFHVIENGSMPAGSDRQAARAQGLTRERRVLNLITPETATSSHYFWAVARAYDLGNADLTEYIREQIRLTFDQDKVILEAQQASLGSNPDVPFPVALRADAGALQGRRLVSAALGE